MSERLLMSRLSIRPLLISAAKSLLFRSGLEIRRIRPDAQGAPRRSNFGEQDLLSGLVARLPRLSRTLVDIGAGDGITHSNSLALYERGFTGAACEGDGERFARLAYLHRKLGKGPPFSLSRLFITPDNVLPWLESCGLPRDFGLLSLDIDGYDHFVLAKILTVYRPGLLCLEINEKIPPPLRFTVLWRPDWVWDGGHCFGQSLSLAHDLASRQGYQLVALEYNNAFFLRRDLAGGDSPTSPSPAPAAIPAFPDLTPEAAYQRGYLDRPDRLQKLPWNRDMEDLQGLSPEAAASMLRRRFRHREGWFSLNYPGQ